MTEQPKCPVCAGREKWLRIKSASKRNPIGAPKPAGPCNFAFFGIVETDEEFAERAGKQIEATE